MISQRYNDVTAHRLLPRKVRSFGSNPMKYSCFIGAPAYYNKPSSNMQVSGSTVRCSLTPNEARLTNPCCYLRKLTTLTTFYRPVQCLYNYCFQYQCGFTSNFLEIQFSIQTTFSPEGPIQTKGGVNYFVVLNGSFGSKKHVFEECTQMFSQHNSKKTSKWSDIFQFFAQNSKTIHIFLILLHSYINDITILRLSKDKHTKSVKYKYVYSDQKHQTVIQIFQNRVNSFFKALWLLKGTIKYITPLPNDCRTSINQSQYHKFKIGSIYNKF